MLSTWQSTIGDGGGPPISIDRLRDDAPLEPADNDHDPAAAWIARNSAEQVRQAIAQLPDEYRSVLVLREIDGCCYETISDILDLPVGTVRSRLHRARHN